MMTLPEKLGMAREVIAALREQIEGLQICPPSGEQFWFREIERTFKRWDAVEVGDVASSDG